MSDEMYFVIKDNRTDETYIDTSGLIRNFEEQLAVFSCLENAVDAFPYAKWVGAVKPDPPRWGLK